MHQMNTTTRLLVLAAIALCTSLTSSCERRCRTGYFLQGGTCKRGDTGATDAGIAKDAMSAADSSDATAADSSKQSQKTVAVSSAGSSARVTGSEQQTQAGTGAAAGASAPPASSTTQSAAETCATEGASRCSTGAPQGSRQTCVGKVWVQSESCAASETCVMQPDGAKCAQVEQLCVGSDGQAVCDGQGQMLLCNKDGTLKSQEMCMSARLCQAGLASGRCPVCMAGEEHRCQEAALEVCAADGMSFMPLMQCPSAALCSANLGMCSDAVCRPGMFTCEGNMLKKCKDDSSGFDEASAMDCGDGTCDAKGGDCDMCQPGQKTCMGDSVLTCDSTGQKLDASPCSGDMKCTGAGQCVQCKADADCSSLTKNCTVGACQNYKCVAQDAMAGKSCTTSGRPGKCVSGGECECTPQCNKPCGDDGCGHPCPDKCGSKMCVNDACVECTSSSQCDGSADGCKVGMCDRSGNCTTTSAGTDGNGCQTNGMDGTCSGGRCVPTPPPPTTTSAFMACGDDSVCSPTAQTCHASGRYCVPACGDGNSCADGSRWCLEGWCVIRPPCPAGLTSKEIDAYNPPTGKATICVVSGL